jgi:hypothetical protein
MGPVPSLRTGVPGVNLPDPERLRSIRAKIRLAKRGLVNRL